MRGWQGGPRPRPWRNDSPTFRISNAPGYKFQFVTLAGFHALNFSMFSLAREYAARGMAAYADLQVRAYKREVGGSSPSGQGAADKWFIPRSGASPVHEPGLEQRVEGPPVAPATDRAPPTRTPSLCLST